MKIYRASAGSGKTFHLTREYLLLVINRPEDFRHTLAVTFTNKATEEMKNRILAELYVLSSQQSGKHLETLCKELNLTENQVIDAARKALRLILYNYSGFTISTIDKFFQQMLKSFAWESGLFDSLSVELDYSSVLNDAIQDLYARLESSKRLKKWMLEFSTDQIVQGSSWDLRKSIRDLGQELFKESFQQLSTIVYSMSEDEESLTSYLLDLKKIKERFEQDSKEIGERGIAMIRASSLEDRDFSRGSSGFISFFRKMIAGDFEIRDTWRTAAENPEKWYTKTDDRSTVAAIQGLQAAGLLPLYQQGIQYVDDNFPTYNTASQIIRNFYTLAILNELAASTRAIIREKQIFLLADTNHLIHGLIDQSESPFIYEKTGHRLHHIMIDEFQDTSILQWENFLPLIRNSLSEKNKVVLVGDVKQSIYRWRNGDWRILAGGIEKSGLNYPIQHVPLDTNWRSRKEVVHFNSVLFPLLAGQIEDFFKKEHDVPEMEFLSIRKAYEGVAQHFPHGEEGRKVGYIRVQTVEKKKKSMDAEVALASMLRMIFDLQDHGYRAADIAILTSRQKEGRDVADFLMQERLKLPAESKYNLNILSVDALILASSRLVGFLIDALRFLIEPNDMIARVAMLEYLTSVNHLDFQQNIENFTEDDFLQPYIGISAGQLRENLRFNPVREIVNQLIELFHLDQTTDELAFLESFLDWLNEENQMQTLSIRQLLERWDLSGKKVKITMPAGADAIQIMTIHKSKGMEFEAVLMPYCDWKLDHGTSHSQILWCRPLTAPFNKVPILPLVYKSDLNQSIFKKEYLEEKIQFYVDHLNLLYVALTRSKSALYLWMPESDKATGSSISSFLWEILNNTEVQRQLASNQAGSLSLASGIFEMGQLVAPDCELEDESVQMEPIRFIPGKKRPALSFRHSYRELLDDLQSERVRSLGTLFHAILAGVRVADDLLPAAQQAAVDGKISLSEAQDFVVLMQEKMKNPAVSSWFSGQYEVRTEAGILAVPGKVKIPDRLMFSDQETIIVDYKFGAPQASHSKQIDEYKQLLTTMKFPGVQAYLWYVNDNQVLAV